MANNNGANAALEAMFAKKAKGKVAKKAKVVLPEGVVSVEERPQTLLTIIKNGRFEPFQRFFENNPDTNIEMRIQDPDYREEESLICTVLQNYTSAKREVFQNMIGLLLQRGANPSSSCRGGVHPIFRAIRLGNLEIVKQLIDAGADINRRIVFEGLNTTGYGNARRNNNNQNNQNNPLSAIQINNVEHNNSKLPLTPLQFAVVRQQWSIVAELLRRGANVQINRLYPNPFPRDVMNNHYDTVLDFDNMPLLVIAIGTGNQDLFTECITRGADVNIRLEYGATPLLIAAGLGKANMVRELLAQGADGTARTDGGRTVGYYGQVSEDPETIEVLRDAGVEIPARLNEEAVPPNMEPAEAPPAPNPNVEHPEYEDYPPEDIPTVAIDRIPNPTEVYDMLMASDSSFEDVYSDDDNIIFRYGHRHGVNTPPDYKYFAYPRSEILKSLKKNEQLRFPCNKSIERAPFLQNVDIGTIYFIIQGPQMFLVPLSHIVGWINEPTKRIFDLVDTGEKTPTLTSWHSIIKQDGLGLGEQQVNIRSSEHCNPGTEKRIYNLAILEMREAPAAAAAAEGGRRRRRRHRTAHRKRMIPRRRVTRKYRQRLTRRKKQVKKQHKKAHKSHKRR